MDILLTHFEQENSDPIGKSIELEDGHIIKKTLGNMTRSIAKVRSFNNLDDIVSFLGSCRAGDTVSYGIPPHQEVAIRTKRELVKLKERGIKEDSNGRPLCARDGKHFEWNNGPGLAMLDYDPQEGLDALTRDQFIDQIQTIIPELYTIPFIWAASSSSHIVDLDTGEELVGLKGQRIYLPAECARDIPNIGKILTERLWLNGNGYIQLSSSGSMLEKTSIDQCVWQPERLDFVGGPYCKAPLVSRRPDPEIING